MADLVFFCMQPAVWQPAGVATALLLAFTLALCLGCTLAPLCLTHLLCAIMRVLHCDVVYIHCDRCVIDCDIIVLHWYHPDILLYLFCLLLYFRDCVIHWRYVMLCHVIVIDYYDVGCDIVDVRIRCGDVLLIIAVYLYSDDIVVNNLWLFPMPILLWFVLLCRWRLFLYDS